MSDHAGQGVQLDFIDTIGHVDQMFPLAYGPGNGITDDHLAVRKPMSI